QRDILHDVAVEGVHVDMALRQRSSFGLSFLGLRLLLRLGRLGGLGRLLRAKTPLRRWLLLGGLRGRIFRVFGVRQVGHTPCFVSRETYVSSGAFSSFT